MVRDQTDFVENWNGVKLPKIWVLDLKECIKIFQVVCPESYYSETFNQSHLTLILFDHHAQLWLMARNPTKYRPKIGILILQVSFLYRKIIHITNQARANKTINSRWRGATSFSKDLMVMFFSSSSNLSVGQTVQAPRKIGLDPTLLAPTQE